MEVYGENDGPARLNREERVRVAGMLKGKTAMAGMDLVDVRKAIARAPRREPDAAGRQRRQGGNVATFLVQLLTWEGSGELDDYYIHRTKREWFESEAALTEAMVKTARKTAHEEGLVDYEQTYRPNDRRPTTKYRVNMWELTRLVIRSDHKRERDKLNRKRRELERAKDDLNLFEERDSGNPEPEVEPGQLSPQTGSTSPPYRRVHQEVTSVDTKVSTPVGEDAEAGTIMNEIYHRMKEEKFLLDNAQYGYNLGRVRKLLNEDEPTAEELEKLPEGFRDYFVVYGKRDSREALDEMRRQKARSVMMANGEAAGTSQGKGSPPEVVETLIAKGGFHKRTLAPVAEIWDFTRKEEPPRWVMNKLGGPQWEKEKHLQLLRRIARKAVEGAA